MVLLTCFIMLSCIKKVGGAGSCNFLTDSCKFGVLIIPILPLNFPGMGGFQPQLFLDQKFRTRRKFFDNFPTARNLVGHDAAGQRTCTESIRPAVDNHVITVRNK